MRHLALVTTLPLALAGLAAAAAEAQDVPSAPTPVLVDSRIYETDVSRDYERCLGPRGIYVLTVRPHRRAVTATGRIRYPDGQTIVEVTVDTRDGILRNVAVFEVPRITESCVIVTVVSARVGIHRLEFVW